MRRATLTALSLALTLALSSCSPAPAPQTDTVFAMDTVMELTVYGDEELLGEAQALIADTEARLSVTREDSEISKLNKTGSGTLSGGTAALLSRALEICALTEGALDITVYPAVRAWGFTTGEYRVPGEDELSALLKKIDYAAVKLAGDTATLPEGVLVDLGSVAKGRLGDDLAAFLTENGVTSALLNLGGNVRTVGAKPDGSPWRVGVRDPFGESYLGILEVRDVSVVTSGGYERYFEEGGEVYWHILDPATARPAKSGLVSATVVGADGTLCDGLSTAVFVMGLDRAVELWKAMTGFDLVLVTEGGEVYITDGLEGSFTLSGDYKTKELQVVRRG